MIYIVFTNTDIYHCSCKFVAESLQLDLLQQGIESSLIPRQEFLPDEVDDGKLNFDIGGMVFANDSAIDLNLESIVFTFWAQHWTSLKFCLKQARKPVRYSVILEGRWFNIVISAVEAASLAALLESNFNYFKKKESEVLEKHQIACEILKTCPLLEVSSTPPENIN